MPPFGPAGAPGTARAKAYHIIFEQDRGWARVFDVALIVAILASVLAVMLDSVASVRAAYGPQLRVVEWLFTALFTVEYALRLWSARPARAYARSFFGVIDLLAVVPTYLSLVVPGGQSLAVIRILRVIRVFRVLKLVQYVGEASVLGAALRASRFKIAVFLVAVLSVVVVVGSVMYFVEGPASGFTSIPTGVYWAIVTLTTVGYGDIAPASPLGQAIASFVMILGYGIIAVPTGIVTAELTAQSRASTASRHCPACGRAEADGQGAFCRWCGAPTA
jgi:voltage-gated potassium channel